MYMPEYYTELDREQLLKTYRKFREQWLAEDDPEEADLLVLDFCYELENLFGIEMGN